MNGAVAAGSTPQSGRLPQRGSQPGKLAEISARPDRLPSFRYACVKIALLPFGGMSKFYALVCTGYIVPALGNHSLSNPSSVGVFGVAAQFDVAAAGAFVVVTFCAIPIAPLLAWQLVPHEPFGIAGWRWMVLIGSAGALIIWRIRRRVPEPPRWLVRCGVRLWLSRLRQRSRGLSPRNLVPYCRSRALPSRMRPAMAAWPRSGGRYIGAGRS